MRSLSTRTAGLAVLVFGLWGGLIPFIGPYFHYSMGPAHAWTWTTGRLWLSVIPGAVAVLGGLMLINAGWRPHARLGALLAVAAGAWFVVGPDVSHLWTAAGAQGVAHGGARLRMWESLGYHTGLGVVITALAAYVLPRFPAVARRAAAEAADRRRGPARREARDGALVGDAAGAHEAAVARRDRVAADEAGAGRREPGAAEKAGVAAEGEGVARREPRTDEGTHVARPEPATATDSAGAGREPAAAEAGPTDDVAPTTGANSGAPVGGGSTATRTGYDAHPGTGRRRRRGGLLGALTRR